MNIFHCMHIYKGSEPSSYIQLTSSSRNVIIHNCQALNKIKREHNRNHSIDGWYRITATMLFNYKSHEYKSDHK